MYTAFNYLFCIINFLLEIISDYLNLHGKNLYYYNYFIIDIYIILLIDCIHNNIKCIILNLKLVEFQ